MILIDDLLQDDFYWKYHILILGHRYVEVDFFMWIPMNLAYGVNSTLLKSNLDMRMLDVGVPI